MTSTLDSVLLPASPPVRDALPAHLITEDTPHEDRLARGRELGTRPRSVVQLLEALLKRFTGSAPSTNSSRVWHHMFWNR